MFRPRISSNGGFAKAIDKRIAELKGSNLTVTLKVGPEASFWRIHEWGSATHREDGSGSAYTIEPKTKDFLRFPDFEHRYKLPHDPHGYALAPHIPISPDNTVSHPGVRPRAMVRKETLNIREAFRTALRSVTALRLDAFKAALLSGMGVARALIVASIGRELPGTRDDGKLQGRTAAEVFDGAAIVELSNKDAN